MDDYAKLLEGLESSLGKGSSLRKLVDENEVEEIKSRIRRNQVENDKNSSNDDDGPNRSFFGINLGS